jgi:hypothetical protein
MDVIDYNDILENKLAITITMYKHQGWKTMKHCNLYIFTGITLFTIFALQASQAPQVDLTASQAHTQNQSHILAALAARGQNFDASVTTTQGSRDLAQAQNIEDAKFVLSQEDKSKWLNIFLAFLSSPQRAAMNGQLCKEITSHCSQEIIGVFHELNIAPSLVHRCIRELEKHNLPETAELLKILKAKERMLANQAAAKASSNNSAPRPSLVPKPQRPIALVVDPNVLMQRANSAPYRTTSSRFANSTLEDSINPDWD